MQLQDAQLASLGRRLFSATIRTHLLPPSGASSSSPSQAGASGAPGSGGRADSAQQFILEPSERHKTIEIDSSLSFDILRRSPASSLNAGSAAVQQHQGGASEQQQQQTTSEIVRLNLRQAKRANSGDYVCQAANQFGQDEKLVKLLVQEPPDLVEEISVVQVDSRSISLAWLPPFNGNSPITGYTLEWAPSQPETVSGGQASAMAQQQQQQGGHAPSKWAQLSVQQPAGTIGPLEPLTSYEVRVRAHNQLGTSALATEPGTSSPASQWQAPLRVTTSEEAPAAPPRDIRAVALSSSAVQVSWLAPSEGQLADSEAPEGVRGSVGELAEGHTQAQMPLRHAHRAASIKGYYLGYRPLLPGSPSAGSGSGAGPQGAGETVAGAPGPYIFKTVSLAGGLSEEGVSAAAAGPSLRLDEPRQRHLAAAEATRAPPTQMEPKQRPSGASGQLNVSTSGGHANAKRPSAAPTRHRVVIGDLSRATRYALIVQAYNSAGPGPQSDPVQVSTLAHDPPPAPQLRVGLASHSSLELHWSFGATSGGSWAAGSGFWAHLMGGPGELAAEEAAKTAELEPHKQLPGGGGGAPKLPAHPDDSPTITVEGYYLYFRQNEGDWRERKLSAQTSGLLAPGNTASGSASGSAGRAELTLVDLFPAAAEEQPPRLESGASSATGSGPSANRTLLPFDTLHRQLPLHGGHSKAGGANFRYVLEGLACGNAYQIYLVAYNSYGSGPPSQVLRARTRGSAPIAPRRADFLRPNSTQVQLQLNAWLDGGCPLANFEIRYKQLLGGRSEALALLQQQLHQQQASSLVDRSASTSASGSGSAASTSPWLLLSSTLDPEQRPMVELRDLQPESWYALAVVAESAAGRSEQVYAFMTLDRMGQQPAEAASLDLSSLGPPSTLPALFRAATSAHGGAFRSLLSGWTGAGASGQPAGTASAPSLFSPLLLGACLCLVLFASCSLVLIRRHSSSHSAHHGLASKELRGGGPTSGSDYFNTGAHQHPQLGSAGTLGRPQQSQQQQSQQQHYANIRLANGQQHVSALPAQLSAAQEQPVEFADFDELAACSPGSAAAPMHCNQQQQLAFQLAQLASSPSKTNCSSGHNAPTNSSVSTNESSSALLLGGAAGGSSTCSGHDSAAGANYTPTSGEPHSQAAISGQFGSLCRQQQQQQQQQYGCEAQSCGLTLGEPNGSALGNKFSTMHHQHQHQNGPSLATHAASPAPAGLGAMLAPLHGHSSALLATASQSQAFKTLPNHHHHHHHNNSGSRPLSTFLPAQIGGASSGAKCQQQQQRQSFVCSGADLSQQQQPTGNELSPEQEQQIYSKLCLLQHLSQMNGGAACQRQATNECQTRADQVPVEQQIEQQISQIYAQNELSMVQQQQQAIGANTAPISVENTCTTQLHHHHQQQQQQQHQQQRQLSNGNSQQHQDDYALPFPPKWV